VKILYNFPCEAKRTTTKETLLLKNDGNDATTTVDYGES
jgi:hypothetical protein